MQPESLNGSLLRYLTRDGRQEANAERLCDLLEDHDFDGLKELFHAFYAGIAGIAGIPHEWYTNNSIADYEGYYAAVFYAYFASLGLDVRVEDARTAVGSTWRCGSTTTCTCSSSRWLSRQAPDRHWRN